MLSVNLIFSSSLTYCEAHNSVMFPGPNKHSANNSHQTRRHNPILCSFSCWEAHTDLSLLSLRLLRRIGALCTIIWISPHMTWTHQDGVLILLVYSNYEQVNKENVELEMFWDLDYSSPPKTPPLHFARSEFSYTSSMRWVRSIFGDYNV